jgi:hypothetical protein
MWKYFMVFILLTVFCSLLSQAQQSGKVFFRDSTILEISEFTKLRTELYNFRKSKYSNKQEGATVDFIRDYKPDKILTLSFRYEKGTGTDQFYYQLLIEGITADGKNFRKKIKTWDWLEMTTTGTGSLRNTGITFFTEKKKLDIVKIVFDL